jgi:hypothetical protein
MSKLNGPYLKQGDLDKMLQFRVHIVTSSHLYSSEGMFLQVVRDGGYLRVTLKG